MKAKNLKTAILIFLTVLSVSIFSIRNTKAQEHRVQRNAEFLMFLPRLFMNIPTLEEKNNNYQQALKAQDKQQQAAQKKTRRDADQNQQNAQMEAEQRAQMEAEQRAQMEAAQRAQMEAAQREAAQREAAQREAAQREAAQREAAQDELQQHPAHNTIIDSAIKNAIEEAKNYTDNKYDILLHDVTNSMQLIEKNMKSYIKQLNNEIHDTTTFKLNELENKINKIHKENNYGIAGATAISSIPYYDNKTISLGVGLGNYKNGNAIGIGLQTNINSKSNFRINIALDTNDTITVGTGFAIGW